ncbi:MAG: hypothetical protein HY080_02765 [Gammaproteobacteria bacterium]|nr:hypothetical protein [Gammaproteobacteria bacterium]
MDAKKWVIIVLVLLTIVYLTSVVALFSPKQRNTADKDSYIADSKKSDGGWETSLGKIMSPFAPKIPAMQLLDGNRLTCSSEVYQSRYRVIQLSSAKPQCIITIPALTDDKYQKGKLSLLDDVTNASAIKIDVVYRGNDSGGDDSGKKSDPPVLTTKQPVSFVVMPKGGSMALKCQNCDVVVDKQVHVRFE